MDFIILNGSPRETQSFTYQYFRYLKINFPNHNYKVYHISRKIKKIEQNKKYFEEILHNIEKADGIIWLYPVYIQLIPAQLKRFIELIFERKKQKYFAGKNTTSISSSGKFYDHLAHNYIHAISEDFGMNYSRGYSTEMMDIMNKIERQRFLQFVKLFFEYCEKKMITEKAFAPLTFTYPGYIPNEIKDQEKSNIYKISIVTDAQEKDESLNNMIDTFAKLMPYEVTIINVHKIDIKGGCLGCIKCVAENICFYSDDFMTVFKEHVITADALVYAFRTQDRYFSSQMKTYLDRAFFNGHRPVFKGQQQAYLVSGPLRHMPILREAIEAMTEVGRANLVGIVTDEYEDSDKITTFIQNIVDGIQWGITNGKFVSSKTFLGVAGHKIFRDLIHTYQIVFPQDYRYYKKEKLFDWPKVFFGQFSIFLKPLMRIKIFRRMFYSRANTYQTKMFEKYIKNEQDE